MRVAIYARLSRAHDNSTSIERQLAACREDAGRRGWEVVGEWVDDGVSGATDPSERPGMSALLAELPNVDAVLVWKLDRLARSFLGFADLTRLAESHEVGLASVTEPLDTTSPMGRAMVRIIAIFAELERDMIRERIAASRAYLRTTDRHISGRPPYGLRIVPAPDGRGKVLERDPEAVDVIREIIARIIDGEPATDIAKDLDRRRVESPRVRTSLRPNPKPSHWSYQAIKHFLGHPSLLGHKLDDRGTVRRDATGAEIIYWEPVCSPETLERARAAMAARSIDRVSPSRRHWLRGVAVCGQCGRPLEQNARNGRRNRERGWDTQTVLRCVGTRAKPCSGVLIADAKLSEFAESEFLAAVGRLEAVESVYVPGSDVEGDLAAVERAITNLRDDRDAGLFDDDEDDYRDRMGALVSRRRALREVPT